MHVADAPLLLAGLELLTLLFFLNLASQLLLARLGGNLVTQTRRELARRLLELEYQELLNNRSFVFGSLIEDVARIVPLVLMVPQLTYNLLLVGVFSVYLFKISAQLAGVLAVFLVATLSVSFAIGKAMRSRFDMARRSEEAVFECFRSISEGKREMSLSNTRKRHFSEHVFDPALQRVRAAMQRAQVLGGAHTAWSLTVLYGAIFAVAYVGYDQFNLPLNTVAHFVVATLFLTNPIALLTQTMHQLAPGMASLRHLATI
jgi:putative ATP-binding cassette transporter